MSSCDTIDLIDGCKNPEKMELTESDERWITDSVQYFVNNNDTFRVRNLFVKPLYSDVKVNCKLPVLYKSSPITDEISDKNIVAYVNINKSPKETNIAYIFSKDTPDNLVVGVNQTMGIIDIENNRPIINAGAYFIYSEYLGNYTIRSREYTEVYKFTDLDESNVPEIDVSSIIVSPLGFLRIEFYDGEVWERIIIE
ncbi:hypothetical protein [Bernardetia litoralis]|uniref:hypothetical protein n=1 Tax=Bernardetia litoralis TaxID=999 RepID=UPI001FE12725|nr:hypothetical protein [Bernardetia litoralis]